ncbi:testis-specific serine/threonine-protein kinase 4-like [Adelges cooleyi]|uniref:testis-specific serine/threonine-protein kinase 4-like n=1 Tax=Adelges cooleyi TaxID=133065 RepID=UPI00217F932D|nr:testis-specific serine/threonine-protein kinase 4-like [Adelges cooleyi]
MKKNSDNINTVSVLERRGYLLRETIGEGTFAKVKLAICTKRNQKVAIKVLSKKNCDLYNKDDRTTAMIKREVYTVKGLKHPNIVRYYEAIETTTRVCIVMEYMGKGSLLDLLRREINVSEDTARKWFGQILDALSYIHKRGIVHRDIKCENVMLDDLGQNVKLVDFGLARDKMLDSNKQFIKSSTFCGSFAYSSPELLRGLPHRQNMSDLWAASVVMYAMLYGQLPFRDDNPNIEIQNKKIKEPSDMETDVEADQEPNEETDIQLKPLKVFT